MCVYNIHKIYRNVQIYMCVYNICECYTHLMYYLSLVKLICA